MKKLTAAIAAIGVSFNLAVCAQAAEQTLIMTIDSPTMTVNGIQAEIDPGVGTAPIIRNERTILPVRAVIEALGGTAAWDDTSKTATLLYNDDEIKLTIDSSTAYLNDEPQELDVSPVIISDRTYLPIRFIAESFGWSVSWDDTDKSVTITKAEETAVSTVHTNAFDLDKGTVLLNNGIEMPILGLGTFSLTPEQAEESVYNALRDGYRLIDTANAYMNERAVGRGIKRAIDEGIVKREDIFLTTKLWISKYEDAEAGIDETLARLNLDYVDLILLHQPYGNYIEGYKGLEKALEEGKTRSIGISNFDETRFDEIMSIATVPPAVLQNETHPYFQENNMREYIDKYGTVLEAWFPLGGRGNTQVLFNDETISSIAEAHNKSSAQIILRWHLQAGDIAIPGSSNPDHIQENFEIFDFELSDEEMERISKLDDTGRFWLMTDEESESIYTSITPDFDDQE